MPLHQHATNCLKGGKVSNFCGCQHCCLAVCSVCGAYEGSLTTDCPGSRVDYDKQQEVYTTDLDYTDAKGWHRSGVGMKEREAHFALTDDERMVAQRLVDDSRREGRHTTASAVARLLGFYERMTKAEASHG